MDFKKCKIAKKKNMKRRAIIECIKKLAASQNFYCRFFYSRLLQAINDMENNDREALFSRLEAQNFADHIDFILYIEG